METYDVLVLGGGTAGSAAAKAAHESGARTAMFNAGEIGGLCILRGCMPTKTMLHSAHLLHHAQHHHTPGVSQTTPAFDFGQIMANKDAKVARFQRAKINSIENGGYDLIDAQARFTGPDTVEAGGKTYTFTKGAVIATGSVTNTPPIAGIEDTPFVTSDELMRLTARPESAIVVGSGAIGLEFAQFFARLGTEVSLVSRRCVFEDVDPLIAAEMAAALRDEPNLKPYHPVTPIAVREEDGGVVMTCEANGEQFEISAELLILATGRRPDVERLGLEAAGVKADERRIEHDTTMVTSNPKIFVAGDASGDRQLLHVANWEGKVAGLGAAQVAGDHRVEQRLHMEVVFYDPPMATVGMSEASARYKGHDTIVASARFPETGRAITMDVQHGAFKLVAERKTGEILGAQILGPRADDLIHIVSSVMFYRGTARDMLAMPWYHPTLAEVLIQLARQIDAQVPAT